MRIAIVDGYVAKFLLQALNDRGAECFHVRSLPRLPNLYANTFTASGYTADLGYDPDPVRVATRLATIGVDRVVAGSEGGVLLADTLTHLMRLPGNDGSIIPARRDKALMADRVRAAGLRVPDGVPFRTVRDAVSWFERSGVPEAVAKPTLSLGTDNVHFCTTATELERACERILGARNLYDEPNTEGIVQERLHGVELYANTVSHEGSHRVAEMWRYIKTEGANRASIYDYEEPVDPFSADGQRLREFTCGVLDALGIRTGAAHTEVMMTAAGPTLIETGARLGGGATPELVEKHFGVSQTGLLADALVDPATLVGFAEERLVSGYTMRKVALINRVAGVVRALDWMAAIESLPTVVAAGTNTSPGRWLPATADEPSSPGFVYLASPDRDEVVRDYTRLRELERTGPYTVPPM